MNIHFVQRQMQLLFTALLSLLGAAFVYGESAAPIPGFPDDLTLRAARAAHAPAEPPSISLEDVPAYVAWRENVRHYARIRVAFDFEQWTTPECSARKEYPELSDEEFIEMTKVSGWVRVSRSTGSLEQDSGFQRFETGTRTLPEERRKWQLETKNYIKIHGDGVYYAYYPERESGSIWKEWRRDDRYPILEVLPPDPKNSRLVNVNSAGTVLDFRTDDTSLIRYHIDPEQGMMPIRIEYYDILHGDSLFLYRLHTVEAYSQTEKGVYVPSEYTMHDCCRQREDGTISVLRRSTYSLTSFEELEKFAPEEFDFTFPERTRVTNHIAGGESLVGAPEK